MEYPKNASATPESDKPVTANPDDSKPAAMPAAKPAQEPERDKASEVLSSIDEDQAAEHNNAAFEHNNAVEISGSDAATGRDERPDPDPAPGRDLEFDQPAPEETAAAQEDKPAARAQDRETVTVACGVIGGYTIRRYVPGPDDGTGKNPLVGGQAVVLPGPSAVEAGINNMRALDPVRSTQDKEFMLGWLKENARNPMVVSGQISIIEENPKRA